MPNSAPRSVSNSQVVSEYLPFMRRYARALTGRQSSGDAYVAAALEAILADRSVLAAARHPRASLYKVLTKIWSSVDLDDASEARDTQLPVERRLAQITRLPRQAFLLVSLEGFSDAEAADILDTDVASVRGLVQAVKAYERTAIRAAVEKSWPLAQLAMLEYPIIGQKKKRR